MEVSTLGTKGPRHFGAEGADGATTFCGKQSAILRDKMSPRTGGLGPRVEGAFVRRRLSARAGSGGGPTLGTKGLTFSGDGEPFATLGSVPCEPSSGIM